MKKIFIKEGLDLNEIIKQLNENKKALRLNKENLQMPDDIYENLPYPLSEIKKATKDPIQRDIALFSCMTILSGVLQNYFTAYSGKAEFSQLFCYIIGNAASGKGFANDWINVGMKFHDELKKRYEYDYHIYEEALVNWNKEPVDEMPKEPKAQLLFAGADTSLASLAQMLYDTDGNLTIFETEVDSFTNALKSTYGGHSDLFRRAFHGERYSYQRKGIGRMPIEVRSLKMSIFLTSTLDQVFNLIPNFDNGLFTRFMFYVLPTTSEFNNPFKDGHAETISRTIKIIGDEFFKIGIKDHERSEMIEFLFNEKHKNLFNDLFKQIEADLLEKELIILIPNQRRLGLIFTRICMLLSLLRNKDKLDGVIDIQANDVDFEIAKQIILKLVEHLQVTHFLFVSYNPKMKYSQMIPAKTSVDDINAKRMNTRNMILSAKDLFTQKLSYRQISRVLYGDESHYSTIAKWKRKNFVLPACPSPDSDTNSINVSEKFQQAQVSVFMNLFREKPAAKITLMKALQKPANYYCKKVNAIRKEKDEAVQSKMKDEMIAFTPSGFFKNGKHDKDLYKHSGFICLDIDLKDNNHIENFKDLKDELKKIVNVAYVAHSVRGKGFFVLIPINNPEKHRDYFMALETVFKDLGIIIDKNCKNVSRLRILSYDNCPYLAEYAVMLKETLEPENKAVIVDLNKTEKDNPSHNAFSNLLNEIEKKQIDITEKYENWFAIGCAIANEFGAEGGSYFHRISRFYPKYVEEETKHQFAECLKSTPKEKRFSLKSIFYLAKENGINFSNVQ